MVYFDVTKSHSARHRSGLIRVSERLRAELATLVPVTPVRWFDGGWVRDAGESLSNIAALVRLLSGAEGVPVTLDAGDTLFTPELFSEEERPGFDEFLRTKKCRAVAVFHDAIPLKLPQWTRGKSVARHADYMRLLAGFDTVLAISQDAQRDLLGFWQWAGTPPVTSPAMPPVEVVTWGANFSGSPRTQNAADNATGNADNADNATGNAGSTALPSLLCVGIIEPRKNHAFLLDVCAALWDAGERFTLNIVGRINDENGADTAEKLRLLASRYPKFLRHLPAAGDTALAALYAQCRAVVFPTLAEGFGLPLVEALWAGAPCVCSDIPVLREQTVAGGCLAVAPNDLPAWTTALRQILTDDALVARLRSEAQTRPLLTWHQTAARVLTFL